MGLDVIVGPHEWWAGPGDSYHFGRSLGGSLGEQAVFKKTRFRLKSWEKMVKHSQKGWTTSKQRNIQSIGTKNLDIACFRKVLQTKGFNTHFCFAELDILKRRVSVN